jgi:hypothetical protein
MIWGVLLILLPLPWAIGRPLREAAEVPRAYKDAGRWVADNLPTGRFLARPGTYVSYYAGVLEYTWMPAADAAATADYARRRGIRYICLDGRLSLSTRPGFDRLLSDSESAGRERGLRLVYDNGRRGADRIVIFEVDPSFH